MSYGGFLPPLPKLKTKAMTYYRIKRDLTDVYLRKIENYCSFVKDELYTLKEVERLGINPEWSNLETVEVSRKKIHFAFGARFAL